MVLNFWKKTSTLITMFNAGTIVKVLIANIPNAGYDYRLGGCAEIGSFVRVNVMNRPCLGVVWGCGDSNLPEDKIKNVSVIYPQKLNVCDLQWIQRMSQWTLIPMGMVLRLIINIPDAFSPPRMEPLYAYNFETDARMTANRQAVADAYSSNDNDAMTVSDVQNIAPSSNITVIL